MTSLVAAFALVAGCYQARLGSGLADRDGGRADGPIAPSPDAGPTPPPDPAPSDARVPPPPDEEEADAGIPLLPRVDGGAEDACEEGEELPEYEGAGCDDSTVACLMSCTDDECVNSCLESDPECERCIFTTLAHCANERGCQPAWDEFACCRNENCDDTSLRECASGACTSEMESWSTCYARRSDACGTEVNDCFF